jgi:ABC-type xylose transport system permease subunit
MIEEMKSGVEGSPKRWLNRTVLGIGLASLFSDWSHEIATTVMPAFLATMGVAAAWLGLIEGVSDGRSTKPRSPGSRFRRLRWRWCMR